MSAFAHRSSPATAPRASAVPSKGEHVETLSFSFSMVDADSALLQLRWGTTIVPLTIRAR